MQSNSICQCDNRSPPCRPERWISRARPVEELLKHSSLSTFRCTVCQQFFSVKLPATQNSFLRSFWGSVPALKDQLEGSRSLYLSPYISMLQDFSSQNSWAACSQCTIAKASTCKGACSDAKQACTHEAMEPSVQEVEMISRKTLVDWLHSEDVVGNTNTEQRKLLTRTVCTQVV